MTAASPYICKDFPTISIGTDVGTSAQSSMALSHGLQWVDRPYSSCSPKTYPCFKLLLIVQQVGTYYRGCVDENCRPLITA